MATTWAGTVDAMRPLCRLRPALALLLLVPALSGCGSSGAGAGGGADPDPAQAIPASAPFYVEAVVRPDDDQADAIKALSSKVAGIDDPGAEIIKALESSDKTGPKVSYAKDIKPWLGKRVGIGVTGVTGDDGTFVLAAGVKDTDAAKAFVDRQAKADGASGTDYGDTTYYKDDDTYVALAGHYVLLSETLPDLKAAIDQVGADKGALGDVGDYRSAMGDLPNDRLGAFYVNTRSFLGLIARQPQVRQSGGAALLQAFNDVGSISGALTATESRALLETRVRTNGSADGILGSAQAPGLVREAPADAVAVLGIADVGKSLKSLLAAVGGGLGGAALQSQLSPLGLDLDRDVFAWIGDVAVFVRGTSVSRLDGAVMIDATSAPAAAAALPRLIGVARQRGGIAFDAVRLPGADQAFSAAVPGLPERLFVARKGARVVIAVGTDAARAGITPTATLDASGAYDRAKGATNGYDPSVIVDVQKVVALVGQANGDDPDFQRAKRYLDQLGLLVVGAKRDGSTYVSRIALTTE